MNAVAVPVAVHRPLPPEEAARADFYALLSRFFQAAPDAPLIRLSIQLIVISRPRTPAIMAGIEFQTAAGVHRSGGVAVARAHPIGRKT